MFFDSLLLPHLCTSIHFIALNPVILDKCGHRGLRCDPNYLFIINVISLSSIKFCLSIYGVFFMVNVFTSKSTIFSM